jgi:hypothetical protein
LVNFPLAIEIIRLYNILQQLYRTSVPIVKGVPTMRNEYIEQIIKLLQNCNDLRILDLIYQLLKKHSART